MIGKRNRLDMKEDSLTIPRHKVSLRFIEVPSIDTSEIKSMIEFQTLRFLPYAREDIVAGFRNTGSYKKGFSFIMLAVAKRQLVEEMVSHNKQRHSSIKLETELLYLYVLKKGIAKHDKVSLVVSISESSLEIMIIDKTKPVFSRGLSERDNWLEEISRSMASYKGHEHAREIEEAVVVYKMHLNIENIKTAIKRLFQVPVNFYKYEEDLNNMGLDAEIDLLPEEYINKRLNRESVRQALVTYVLLFIISGILVSFFAFKLDGKNKRISALSKKIDAAREDINQLNSFLKKTEVLKNQERSGANAINILKGCYGLAQPDIFLSEIDYDGQGVLYCKGMAKDMPHIFNFIKALEKSAYFKKVEMRYAAKKEIKDREFSDFNIACFTK